MRLFFGVLFLACLQASSLLGQGKEKVPQPCYQNLLKLEPVYEDTTMQAGIPYQTFLFRYQREWLILVADTATFYSFTCKKVKTDLGKIDSLVPNSVAFSMNVCKLLNPKELTLKQKKRTIGDLKATHYYKFSRSQQRLYTAIQAAETGEVKTFVQKTWNEFKQFPQIFSFLVPKPDKKLQEQIKAMKDQAKKMKDEAKKLKDQATKLQENLAMLQEEKKKLEEQMKKQAEEKKKEQAKDSTNKANNATLAKNDTNNKENKTNNKENKINNKENKTNNKENKNNTAKDSLIIASTKKMSKQDSISKEMDRVLREIELMGNIDELKLKQQQLLEQKAEFDHPENKKTTELSQADNEKRKVEMMAKIHDINDLLRELADEKASDIVSKRMVLKNRRDYLLQEIKKMDKKPQ